MTNKYAEKIYLHERETQKRSKEYILSFINYKYRQNVTYLKIRLFFFYVTVGKQSVWTFTDVFVHNVTVIYNYTS